MKRIVLSASFVCLSLVTFSQEESSKKCERLAFGFNLGVNYSNLIGQNEIPENASMHNNAGFRLGVISEFRATNYFSIAPKAELSFNNSHITFNDGVNERYDVYPINLSFASHFVFKLKNEKRSPYFLLGPNVRIPVVGKLNESNSYPTSSDFAIDFGIGLENHFSVFNFAPELRYSFGLLNVNRHPSIQSINFHNISLVFNFLS